MTVANSVRFRVIVARCSRFIYLFIAIALPFRASYLRMQVASSD